jgi:hypothetical protein
MNITQFDLALQANPILNGLDYASGNNGLLEFSQALNFVQRTIVLNMAELIKGDTNHSCNICTQGCILPQHIVLLIFQQVVHRYNGVFVDGILIAKHGPLE